MTLSVMVVDDDFHVAKLHAGYVEQAVGFAVVHVAASGANAIQYTGDGPDRRRVDLALVDLYLPDCSGLDLIPVLDCDVFVLTAATESKTVRSALSRGALAYLVKPFTQESLNQRLIAYARYRSIIDGSDTLDQSQIDQAVRTLYAETTRRPKGHSTVTERALAAAVLTAHEPVTAAEVAEKVGVSRATAQRYLAYLADSGRIHMQLRYGSTGRPEHRFSSRPASS